MAHALLLVSTIAIAAASPIVCSPDVLVGCNARPCSNVSCPGVEGATCVDNAHGSCGCFSFTMLNGLRVAAAECDRPLGLHDSGRTISLHFGKSFQVLHPALPLWILMVGHIWVLRQVELESNPSTGYWWTNVLTTDAEHGYTLPTWPIASEYKSYCPAPEMSQPIIVGCGGIDTYTFRALHSAQIRIVKRFASLPDITDEFTLNVQVQH
eukprot:m51a1_g12908 hypothetical protein (210) ;mRNA; r:1924-2629